MNADSPKTVADIIDLYRSMDLLGELGMTTNHAGAIKTRGRIPGHWHVRMVEVAQLHRLPVSYELLARLAVQPSRPDTSSPSHQVTS